MSEIYSHLQKVSCTLFCLLLTSFLAVSCLEKDIYQGSEPDNTDDSSLKGPFDCVTTKTIDLNVEYKLPEEYGALFEVYDANPLSLDEDGQIGETTLVPLYTRSTDSNGKYSKRISIPASMKQIYIYSSDAGVPILLKADVSGETVSLSEANRVNMDEETASVTRAVATFPNSKTVSDRGNFLTLGENNAITWVPLGGKPLNVDATETAKFKEVHTSVLVAVNAVLAEGVRPTNLQMGQDYKTDLKTKDGKVYLRYVCGKSASMGTLAYYCYPADVNPTKAYIESLPKAIVFANTMDESYAPKNSSLERGTCVELKYITPEGKVTDEAFPQGTHIGFVLYNNGYKLNEGPSNKAINTKYPFYSTPVSDNGGGLFRHTATFSYNKGEMVIVGFEDWTSDYDYNDFVFNVTGVEGTTPVEDKTVTISGGVTKGTLAFEDNWPNEGDYDMNDVIVKYKTETFYTRTAYMGTSRVEYSKDKVVDTYELVWTGASYRNGFGYKVKTGDDVALIEVLRNNKVVEPEVSTEPDGSKVIMLFTDARKELGIENVNPKDMPDMTIDKVTYVVTTTYNRSAVDQIPTFADKAPYNPFITVNSQRSHEIHLIDYTPTSKMSDKFWSLGNDVSNPATGEYYRNKDFWPFALNIDASGNSNADAWKVSDKLSQYESVRIDKSYPNFVKWANSKGTDYITWWK